MIITVRLDTGSNLEETGGKVKRAFIAVVAVGLLLTAGLTIGYDAMARRRQRRRLNLDDLGPSMPAPMSRPTYPQQDTGGIRRQPVGLGGTGGDIGAGRSLTASTAVEPVPTPRPRGRP